MLQSILKQLLILAPKTPLQTHRAGNTTPSANKHQDERHQVPRLVRLHEKVRRHDIAELAQNVVQSDRSRLLLRVLGQSAGDPGLDQGVRAEEPDDVNVQTA